MTSIEIINEYIKNYEDIFRYTNNPKIKKGYARLIKEMELVNKDLEVLEILKRKAELITEDGIISIRINYINMFKDDFDKIIEWLEYKEV